MAESNLGFGPLTIKYLVFIFNLIFFMSGLVLIIIGGVAQGFFKEYVQFFDDEFKTPAIGMILLGTVILFISFFGCCGARYENVCMLYTFGIFMGILLLCEIAAIISIAILRFEIEHVISTNMKESMNEYSNETVVKLTWDDIQGNYLCCGTANYTDWAPTPFGNETNVPDSCCLPAFVKEGCGMSILNDTSLVEHVYHDGCALALKSATLKNMGAIVGASVGLAFVQLIGIWMSFCLIKAIKERYEIL